MKLVKYVRAVFDFGRLHSRQCKILQRSTTEVILLFRKRDFSEEKNYRDISLFNVAIRSSEKFCG